MSNPVGNSKYCFTLLAAHIADVPKAHVLSCVHSNTSPVTMVTKKQFGDPFQHLMCTALVTLSELKTIMARTSPSDLAEFFKACSPYLNGISEPCWEGWPLIEPAISFCPKSLHHWWKFANDHDLKWASNLVSADKLDY